jgi:isocitrate dehydrogenase
VGVKFATIMPNGARIEDIKRKNRGEEDASNTNGTMYKILDGATYFEPIICRRASVLVPHWPNSIVVGHHGDGGSYRAAKTKSRAFARTQDFPSKIDDNLQKR